MARTALVNLRAIILNEVPKAEEVMRYGIPTYKRGRFVVSYAAFKKHCSFFPGHTRPFAEQLTGYKLSRGTIQFVPEDPLPEKLIRAIVRARLAEMGP